jgi:hypothetical protein
MPTGVEKSRMFTAAVAVVVVVVVVWMVVVYGRTYAPRRGGPQVARGRGRTGDERTNVERGTLI